MKVHMKKTLPGVEYSSIGLYFDPVHQKSENHTVQVRHAAKHIPLGAQQ